MKKTILFVLAIFVTIPAIAQEYAPFGYDGPSCDAQRVQITEALDRAWEEGTDPDISFLFSRHQEQCLMVPPPEPIILEHFTPEYYAYILHTLIVDFQAGRPEEYFTDHYRGKRNMATCRRIIIEEVRALGVTDVPTIQVAKTTCIDIMGDIWYRQNALDLLDKGEDVEDAVSAAINEVFGREIRMENVKRIGRVLGTIGITAGAIVILDKIADDGD